MNKGQDSCTTDTVLHLLRLRQAVFDELIAMPPGAEREELFESWNHLRRAIDHVQRVDPRDSAASAALPAKKSPQVVARLSLRADAAMGAAR